MMKATTIEELLDQQDRDGTELDELLRRSNAALAAGDRRAADAWGQAAEAVLGRIRARSASLALLVA